MKLITAELAASISVHGMQATVECILETFSVVIREVQADNGSGFRGDFKKLLQECGIAMQVIQPRSPKQNGSVKRCQEHLAQIALRTFLHRDYS